MSDILGIEQWLLVRARQFEDQHAPQNLTEGLRVASAIITALRAELTRKDEAAARIEQLEAAGDKARARGDRMRMALEDIAYPNPLHNEDDLMRIARTVLEVNNV